MKTCDGYWPDFGTPCRRVLSAGGHCPKAADPAHRYARQPDDDRWDWVNVGTLADPDQWIKGACKHLTPLPVVTTDALDGTEILVAWLCPDCDGQFEPDRFKADGSWTTWDKIPEPNGFERWAYGGLIARVSAEAEQEFRKAFPDAALKRPVILPDGMEVKRINPSDVGTIVSPREAEELARRTGRIPSGYRVNTLSRDPYEHLIFVGGGVINKNAPVKDPWIIRFTRAYLDANLAVWNWLKDAADWVWVPALAAVAIVSVITNGGLK